MIKQSPESPMPEPYRTYVAQRSEAIAVVLEPVVDTDVQLCPRAIYENERIVGPEGIIYGAMVKKKRHGYKTVLYNSDMGISSTGRLAHSINAAFSYADQQLRMGNRVRLKDAKESDGQGQYTAGSEEEVLEYATILFKTNQDDYAYREPSFVDEMHSTPDDLRRLSRQLRIDAEAAATGVVIMPHLEEITDQFTIGMIDLGRAGQFRYAGRETTVVHDGQAVYGGSEIGLARVEDIGVFTDVSRHFEIPKLALALGENAIERYEELALAVGRVSFDVIVGRTRNDTKLTEVVDVTPRVGGVTPAEVLAIRELASGTSGVMYARSRLLYNPRQRPTNGTNFVDTPTLIINAEVTSVENVEQGLK